MCASAFLLAAAAVSGCFTEGGANPGGRGGDRADVPAGVGPAADGLGDGGGASGAGGGGNGVGGPPGGDGAPGESDPAPDEPGPGSDGGDGPPDGGSEGDAGGEVGSEGEGEGGGDEGGDEGGDGQGGPEVEGGGGGEGEGEGPACQPIGDRELCGTGVDEDCDGETDEGFEIDEPCEAGIGACHRTAAWVCTVDGRGVFCDVRAGNPTPEVCGNSVDDDCDGETDERFPVGEPCEVGLGGCRALGAWECSADGRGVVCSAQRGDGRLELCGDSVDNDCDGQTDEAPWLGGACAGGVGVCRRDGRWECGPDGNPRCSAAPGPAEEPDGERTCDGRDNDCDGGTDEFPAGGGACEAGLGQCRREGVLVCQADGRQVCSVRAGEPREPAGEVTCDGLDNDCDGAVDEGMGLGEPCAAGVGLCRVDGRIACDHLGRASCDARPPEPPEPAIERTCDGSDNDCDGEVDEGCDDDSDDRCDDAMAVVGPPPACPASPPGPGDDCDDDNAAVRPGLRDACNGVDDDCDGRVDEDGAAGGRCVPPYVGALARSQGRWGYGGEPGLEGASAACRVMAAHAGLCARSDLLAAAQAGDLAGATGDDGLAVSSFWVDTPDFGRCVRDAPWTENDPDSGARGRAIFIDRANGRVVAEQDTLCSVPRNVACCGWD